MSRSTFWDGGRWIWMVAHCSSRWLPRWRGAGSRASGGRGGTVGKSRHRLRNILVAAEIALAVVLLVGAGLMVRGFRALIRNGAAMEPATLLTMRLAITQSKHPEPAQVAAFCRRVLERIGALPGVKSAVAVTALPYTGNSSDRNFTVEGRPP